jgi:hypothetical protein
VTSRSIAGQRRWSYESAYFQGVFILDHLDHLFIKRNRNKYTSKNRRRFFPKNAGLGGPSGPKQEGTHDIDNWCITARAEESLI